jgi:hypothetical protein
MAERNRETAMMLISEILQMLMQAQKLCKRGIFETSAVDKRAVAPLLELKAAVQEYLIQNPCDVEALRTAAYVECYLLNFKGGLHYLEKVVELSGDRKDKQKLINLRQLTDSLNNISLSPEELLELGAHLNKTLEVCDHSLKHTKEWLDKSVDKKKHASIIKGLRNSGGYCDCEVLCNVVAD